MHKIDVVKDFGLARVTKSMYLGLYAYGENEFMHKVMNMLDLIDKNGNHLCIDKILSERFDQENHDMFWFIVENSLIVVYGKDECSLTPLGYAVLEAK